MIWCLSKTLFAQQAVSNIKLAYGTSMAPGCDKVRKYYKDHVHKIYLQSGNMFLEYYIL